MNPDDIATIAPFSPLLAFIACYVLGYLIGSIPFGLLLTNLAGHGDIRSIGSGNIGATNVLRTGKKGLAALTLLLDLLKGLVAVLFGSIFTPQLAIVAGVAALLGHSYPIWLKYKGGKGVATACGITLGLCWPLGTAVAFTWIIVLVMVRLSSVAALSGAAMAPIYAWLLDRPDLAQVYLFISAFIWFRHRVNIQRLIAGTEPPISFSKNTLPAASVSEDMPIEDDADDAEPHKDTKTHDINSQDTNAAPPTK